MNILQVQDRLKGLSEQQLATEMQSPSGVAPQFLVLTELQRRKRVRDDFQAQSAKAPATTVAQDAVAAAGVPQAGIAPMARALAPKTDVTQNTGITSLPAAPTPEQPQQMAGGGMVRKMAEGSLVRKMETGEPIVLGGRTYTQGRDGIYRDKRGNVLQTAGQDLAGITSLPYDMGKSLAGYSANLANQMNERLTAQDRANLAERVQGQRVMPATTGYTYPDVPVEDMTAMLSQAGPEFERTGRGGRRSTAISGDVAAGADAAMLDDMVALGLVGANDRAGPMTMGRQSTREEEAIAARDELLSGLVNRYDNQQGPAFEELGRTTSPIRDPGISPLDRQGNLLALQDEIMRGRAGPMTAGRDKPRAKSVAAGPSFEQVGREVGAASLMDMANTAQARDGMDPAVLQDMIMRNRAGPMTSGRDFSLLGAPELQNPALRTPAAGGAGLATALEEAAVAAETPIERARRVIAEDRARRAKSVVPQYTEDTVFDPMTGVPISGGGVVGETPIPNSTGNWWEDFTMSDAARKQLNETRAKVEATKAATNKPAAETPTADTADEAAADTGGAGGAGGVGGAGGSGSGGVGGMGGGAAGPQTDYEKALADALARNDKRAEQDKWMALAQAGLALMSSNSPTLAGAIGEAGVAGLGAYRGSRDEAEKTRMDILGTQYQMDMDRQKMAMARAQAAGGGKPNKVPLGLIKGYEDKLAAAVQELDALGEVPEANWLGFGGGEDPETAQRRLDLANTVADLKYVLQGSYATHGVPYVGGTGGVSEEFNLADPE